MSGSVIEGFEPIPHRRTYMHSGHEIGIVSLLGLELVDGQMGHLYSQFEHESERNGSLQIGEQRRPEVGCGAANLLQKRDDDGVKTATSSRSVCRDRESLDCGDQRGARSRIRGHP
jgi:hypothetical protein